MATKIEDICRDFPEWPRRWQGIDEDLPYGENLNAIFKPFIEHLIDKGLSRKTIRKHCDNLWLLGGEIIRHVSLFNEYQTPPMKKLLELIDLEGGPLCRHLDAPSEINSYDSTCRALYKYLKQ